MRFVIIASLLAFILYSCKQDAKPSTSIEESDSIVEHIADEIDTTPTNVIDSIKPTVVVDPTPALVTENKAATLNFTKPKPPQTFSFNTQKDSTFVGEEGTKVTFPANALIDKNGKPITGAVEIELTEYYTNFDILKANLSTSSNGKQLETGGMINVKALQNGRECKLANGKSIEIEFESENAQKDSMQIFHGEKVEANNVMNWVAQEESEAAANDTDEIITLVTYESTPKFPGGMEALMSFYKKNIVFPESAKDSCIQGKVFVAITVNEKGKVIRTDIVKGIRPDFNQAALKGLENLPDFEVPDNPILFFPRFYLPINFKIRGCAKPKILDGKARSLPPLPNTSNNGEYEANLLVFKSTRLGWINCDRFTRTNRTLYTQNVNTEAETYTNCYLIFHEINSVMPSYPNSTGFKFLNVPVGSKVTLVAISAEDDELKYDVQTFKTQKGNSKRIQLEKGDEEAFKELLKEQGV
ncbi:MAG: energy transducer TonB [Bacteroidia bacterium]